MIAVQNTIFIEIDNKFYMGITDVLLNKLCELEPQPSVAELFYNPFQLKDIYFARPLPLKYLNFRFIAMDTEEDYSYTVNLLYSAFQPKIKLIHSYGV